MDYTGTTTDADGTIASYAWNFEEGSPASTDVEDPGLVTYNTAGTFTTTFSATDDLGVSCLEQTRTIEVTAGDGDTSINSTSAGGGTPVDPVTEQPIVTDPLYSIVAINDLGMHCGDLDARISSILPPFNVLHTQVVQRGITGLLQILGEGQTVVEYSAASNPDDPGLATAPSLAGNGTVFKTNFWDVVNIGGYDPFYPPVVTPCPFPSIAAFDDFGRENAYPLMRIQAKVGGNAVATVDTAMPISAEADCQNCHAAPNDGGNGSATQALVDAGIPLVLSIDDPQDGDGGVVVPLAASVEWASDLNLLKLHDLKHGTTLETAYDPQTGLATECASAATTRRTWTSLRWVRWDRRTTQRTRTAGTS